MLNTKEYNHLYYIKNKEKVRKRTKERYIRTGGYINNKSDSSKNWYRNNREKGLLRNAKVRANKRNLLFNLNLEDIIIPDYCPVLGIKINLDTSTRDDSPSIDRIDINKGYIKDNIRIICHRANRLKNDASLEEIEKIYKYMKGEI